MVAEPVAGCVEAGGIGPAFGPETVADSAERYRNVLRHLGLLAGTPVDHGGLTLFSNFAWVNDVFGDLIEETKSPFEGVVLAIGGGPVMPNGEVLVHVGLDPRRA